MQGADDLLGLLLSYMRKGMRTRVRRGVIVGGVIMVCVTRVIMSWMRLRWRVDINMIVIRLLRLSTDDEGIRQRRSRRSRHFSLYFLIRRIRSLSAELASPSDLPEPDRDLGN